MKNYKFILLSIVFLFIISFIIYVSFIKEEVKTELVSDSGMISLDEKIGLAFLSKFPSWSKDDIEIKVVERRDVFARGDILFRKSTDLAHWFAVKSGGKWEIISYDVDYFGICQDFQKYQFPLEIIPDCWDSEKKIIVNTSNPQLYYYGLTIDDKEALKKAFLEFVNNDQYSLADLNIKFGRINGEYLQGAILFSGVDNYSASHFFAVKDRGEWKILYYGQENPPCKSIQNYKFPKDMISNCWNGTEWVEN